MALGKAVFPKAFQLLEDAQGEVFRAAVFYHSGYQPMAEMFDAALALPGRHRAPQLIGRSEEHTSELQSLMRISYAVFCLKKKKTQTIRNQIRIHTTNHTT